MIARSVHDVKTFLLSSVISVVLFTSPLIPPHKTSSTNSSWHIKVNAIDETMGPHLIIPTSILSYSLLSSYCLCGGVLEHAAVFRGWQQIHDPRQLKALQSVSGRAALHVYVVPKTALTVFNAYLAIVNPPAIVASHQRKVHLALWFGLAALCVSWISSYLVQVPLQLRIQQTGDQALVRRLNSTTWVRTGAIVLHACSVLWMLASGAFLRY
ncbi:hypothetical protein B0H63DRAFT_463949 [Podospora didyma]|uniref:Uncharacterized protein n=1 Tax=Podospora didyma TaxID=330526 RepID=A0AAE0NXG7_9PEZI|nr:hypothetical protein B0H63DRAFT_463949 [Podospora didyma]